MSDLSYVSVVLKWQFVEPEVVKQSALLLVQYLRTDEHVLLVETEISKAASCWSLKSTVLFPLVLVAPIIQHQAPNTQW